MAEAVRVPIIAETKPFEDALENLRNLSASFGAELTGALKGAAVSGRNLDDVLRRVGMNLAGRALNAGLQPLQGLVSAFAGQMTGALGSIIPFAKGGVVNAPTFFPHGGGMGVMGEAGAEAVLPLARGPDGRLGVAQGGGGGGIKITFNVTTPDAQSFAKSEGQISTMLARAVARGARFG
ncbi:phage tail tape measure protein [Nitratireductor basaltis]|uniref:Prophage tail length tape measure protein n=1 Tax=Nitratireductor basaltis TaxID=472175 RepID=A0A084UCG0_9HYPH|nr:phage tail tape measure protein [Nitratireductor basaltis]KFB10646.1 Prophage tail length tape measure protein precursor [Nitratireductor basaltis]